MPKDATHALCLAVINREEQRIVSKVPLEEFAFGELWSEGVQAVMKLPPEHTARMTPANHIAKVLRDSLQLRDLRNEFESAKYQNKALHHLIFDAMSHQGQSGSRYGDEIEAGIVGLIADTTGRLDKVYNALEKMIGDAPAAQPATR